MKSPYFIGQYDYFIIAAILIITIYISFFYYYKNKTPLVFCFINTALVIFSGGFRYYSGIPTGFDDAGYYYSASQLAISPNIGTNGVVWGVGFLTQYLGLSFIVITSIFVSLVVFSCNILLFAFIRITPEHERGVVNIIFTIIVPVSIGFWCGAIGKDAMTILGSGLIIGALSQNKFFSYLMILGMALYIFPRPHLAPVLLLSFTVAMLLGRDINIKYKIPILTISITALAILTPIAIMYFGNGTMFDMDQIIESLDRKALNYQDSGSFIDVSSMPYPIKIFAYLFRPSVLEIDSFSTFVAAVNNALILALFLYIIFTKKEIIYSFKGFRFIFSLLFPVISIFIFSYSISNLGIAMRQKWMFLPMLIFALNLARLHSLDSSILRSNSKKY